MENIELRQESSKVIPFHSNPATRNACEKTDLVVFSHLRWNFVFQRPQHLMTRFARERRVFFVEEPMFEDRGPAQLKVQETAEGICSVVPHLPAGLKAGEIEAELANLMSDLFESESIHSATFWYYTPMALNFTRHLPSEKIIYDCMDELSHFKNAPVQLLDLEKELFQKADLVFTGGHSLFEAKKKHHHNIHPFPSSIDRDHFARARLQVLEPDDQASIPHPRIGFFGVVDERMNLELLESVARLRPDWHFVILGPVVKIHPEDLPKRANIHYLGQKSYKELPAYLSGWDVAMMPFALNDSTRFISPTKTPEYLAAGRPVISTPIRDVVHPYGRERLVVIAESAEDFVEYTEALMKNEKKAEWLDRVDQFLSGLSWDQTWKQMARLEKNLEAKLKSQIRSVTSSLAESL